MMILYGIKEELSYPSPYTTYEPMITKTTIPKVLYQTKQDALNALNDKKKEWNHFLQYDDVSIDDEQTTDTKYVLKNANETKTLEIIEFKI